MDETIIATLYGKVKGERKGDVSIWKGIPYAKPPIGSLRFCPPQEPESWVGVLNATQFGPIALQPPAAKGLPIEPQSEDCLHLNVWSPHADDRLRPVMVWIHGGGYLGGSGSFEMYDGTSFAERGDVVIVTFNYRLGAFGFLHLAEFGGEKYAASGNCGLLDQIAALKWVQRNIRAFGGDPKKVTVFGESSGAMSVGTLLTMPEAKGMFSQAIMESPSDLVISAEAATRATKKFLAALHLQPYELEKLVEMPAEEILKASMTFPMMTFCPVVDRLSIPVPPFEAICKGVARDIPVICGSNKDEYRFFTAMDPSYRRWDEAEILRRLERTFDTVWPEFAQKFQNQRLDKTLYLRVMSYYSFIYPTLKYSEALSLQGSTWVYQFSYEHPKLGACHAFELPFVWYRLNSKAKNFFSVDSPEGVKLSEQMHQSWIAFAHTGNPNTPELTYWPPFDLENRSVMVFNTESKVENDPYIDRKIWEYISSRKDYRPMRWG